MAAANGRRVIIPAALAALVAGCASASLPKIELPETATLKAALPTTAGADLTPTEAYERIARGILKCWLGAEGPLKGRYVFGAEVKPPTRGGGADLGLHERDPSAPASQGTRVWRASLATSGTAVEVQNIKLDEATAADMHVDVDRWIRGEERCATMGAMAQVPAPVVPPPTPAKTGPGKGGPAKGGPPATARAQRS